VRVDWPLIQKRRELIGPWTRLGVRPPPRSIAMELPPTRQTPTMGLKQLIGDLCFDPKHTRWIAPLLNVGDALLCVLIIWKIPCELSTPARLDEVDY
jgi:hypothetical protein